MQVQSRSRVLDPFCGSCSLLLPAAKLGASTWGADVAGPAVAASVLRGHGGMSGKAPAYSNSSEAAAFRLISASNEQGGEAGICVRESNELRDARVDTENLQGLYEDFERLGLVRPELVIGDVADEESAVRRPMCVDGVPRVDTHAIFFVYLADQNVRHFDSVCCFFGPSDRLSKRAACRTKRYMPEPCYKWMEECTLRSQQYRSFVCLLYRWSLFSVNVTTCAGTKWRSPTPEIAKTREIESKGRP